MKGYDLMTNLPSIPGGGDDGGFSFVAGSAKVNNFLPLDFTKGKWTRGYDRVPEPADLEYVVFGVGEAWRRLERDTSPQRIPHIPDEDFPAREELGDLDQHLWPKFDGRPSDPWSLTYELFMGDRQTGQLLVYTAAYVTAKNIVADLCRLVEFQQRQRGVKARPVVKIGTTTLNLRRGPVEAPTFDLFEWIGGETVPEAPPSKLREDLTSKLQDRSVIDPTATSTAPQPSRRKIKAPRSRPTNVPWDDLDDEIPV
jgi:hypothetical protein